MKKAFIYNKTTLFVFAIFLSLLFHLLFFMGINIILTPRKPVISEPKIIEIIPYYPKEIKPPIEPNRDTRFYGPKNIQTGKDTLLPHLEPLTPKTLDVIENIIQNKEIAAIPPKKTEPPEEKKGGEIKINTPVEEEPKKEQKRPEHSLKQLIPKETDLLAKLPKEESINLNTGTVKGSKELILNTKEYKYWSYLEKVKRKVESVWQYPELARERGIGGKLKISFSISKDGRIENKILIESSQYRFLDDAAMKALRDASPLPPFPKDWDIEKLNIDGTFIYVTNMIR